MMDSGRLLCLAILCLLFSTIGSQFINVERILDGTTILVCHSKDSHDLRDDLSYEWYRDNDKRIQNNEYYEVKGKELILKRLQDEFPHYYKCVIELKNIGAKFAISKKIVKNFDLKLYRNKRHKNQALKFSTNMMPMKNFELGSTGKIHCKATGSQNIYWRKNQDEELPKDIEDVNGTLVFNNVELGMKGIYTCFATNDSQQISYQVDVGILPSFKDTPPKKMLVNELQTVLLNCRGYGSPMPTIKWDFETEMISTDERIKIFENGSLYIQHARSEDSGRYGCTIGNSAGFKRTETLLTVKLESDVEETTNLLSNKAVLITCLLAVFYILCVVVLMIWCRQKRTSKQNESDPEQLKLNEENDNHEEKATPKHKAAVVKSLSSSYTFDIRYEKISDPKKIGTDNNFKMDILTGFLCDSDLPPKVVNQENCVTDEIRMQQQTKVLIRTIKRDQDDKIINEFRQQIDLYCSVDSQNVSRLLGLSKEPKIYGMILEHNDDLKTYLINKTDISISDLLKFCHQLANGVNAIHAANFTHRDISLSNLTITKDNIIKLTSKTPTDLNDYYEHNGLMLPLRHSAPELLMSSSNKNKGDIKYSFASDIYAFGITMWEILNKGNQPFKCLSKDEFIKKLQTKSLDYNSLITSSIPENVNEILLKCLKAEASERIDCSDDLINCLGEAISKSNTS